MIFAIPANASTAARALLIDAAVQHGFERRLQFNLLRAENLVLRQSSFRLLPNGNVGEIDGHFLQEGMHELSAGRYVSRHSFGEDDSKVGHTELSVGSPQPHRCGLRQ